MRPRCARYATPAKPPLSSSTVPLISIGPGSVEPARAIASAANTAAAMPGLHVARAAAVDRPSLTTPPNGSTRPAVAGRHDVEMAVQVDDRPRPAAPRADDVDARMPRRVLGAPLGGDILDVEAARRRGDRR